MTWCSAVQWDGLLSFNFGYMLTLCPSGSISLTACVRGFLFDRGFDLYVLITFCWFWTTKLPFLEIHPLYLQYPEWHQSLLEPILFSGQSFCTTSDMLWLVLVPSDQSIPFMTACHWFCVHVPGFSVWITVFGALMTQIVTVVLCCSLGIIECTRHFLSLNEFHVFPLSIWT